GRRSRSARIARNRVAPFTEWKTTPASTTSEPIRSSVEPTPPSPEKKIESRIAAPKSAIVPAATINCRTPRRSRRRLSAPGSTPEGRGAEDDRGCPSVPEVLPLRKRLPSYWSKSDRQPHLEVDPTPPRGQ